MSTNPEGPPGGQRFRPKLTTAKAADLVVRIVDDGERHGPPRALVVLNHGYGAPGTDLVGLANEAMLMAPELRAARFVFPEAPLPIAGMPFGGRAWWSIDVERFARATMNGDVQALTMDTPEGLPRARRQLLAALEVLEASTPDVPLVLGGFSQGAMLATDVALRRDVGPAALCIFSGTLLSRPEWTSLAPRRAGLNVWMCHGTSDPLLPFALATELKDLLSAAGLNVRFHSFAGGHTIDADGLAGMAQLVASALAKAAPAPQRGG